MAQMIGTDIRRRRVQELYTAGKTPTQIASALYSESIANPHTGKPYTARTVRNDLKRIGAVIDTPARQKTAPKPPMRPPTARAEQVVSEMIGRVAELLPEWRQRRTSIISVDKTQTDYQFYDKLRRGQAKGFEISGTFCQPIVQTIAAFEFGSSFTITLARGGDPNNPRDERVHTDRQLERFVHANMAGLYRAEENKLALGDQYIIINPDGELSYPSPDTVDVETDALDYRKVVCYRLRTRLRDASITDEYREDMRTITTEWHRQNGARKQDVSVHPNLIDEIPVVHMACDRGGNEIFGHPIYQALFRVFSMYDDLFEKSTDGVMLMGNPIPVFTGLDDVNAAIEANDKMSDEIYYDQDGSVDARRVLKMDKLPAIMLGNKGDFKFAAPERGFTQDVMSTLGQLFTLISNYTRIPEFLWGMSVAQSKASTETQLPPFIQYIQARRIKIQEDIEHLARIWLKVKRIVDPRIVVDDVRVTWQPITLDDANILLQQLIYLDGKGYIQPRTVLEKLHMVADPTKELRLAAAQRAALPDAEDDSFTKALNRAARMDLDPANNMQMPALSLKNIAPPDPDGGRNVPDGQGRFVGEPISEIGHLSLADGAVPPGVDPAVSARQATDAPNNRQNRKRASIVKRRAARRRSVATKSDERTQVAVQNG